MRIDPAQHGWMTAPETVAVMAALGEARFVGGAVRNALLGVGVVDIDIAVPMPPTESLARLKARGIKVVETGLDHGTVTAIAGTRAFEITSLRRDVETDGRHAVIAFTDDWAEDAARRDFTINALYAAANGEIFDYATGVEDLIAGKVRFMGDAKTRIAEDYLRVLRLFRFHAWYGKGEIDAEGLRAVAEAKDKLKSLSAERVAKELLRLLEAGNPAPVLRVMAATGILPELLPGALCLPRLERLAEIEADNLFPRDAILRLAALMPDDDSASEAGHAAADALKLS
ncbi:MAG: CCA tRNA nucleotidyltransferase, partial [Alphaproteobacteria bacterium]|nr:CCA tRNA nucleotidyltransferase [Alphaproteobacteria bacterium]